MKVTVVAIVLCLAAQIAALPHARIVPGSVKTEPIQAFGATQLTKLDSERFDVELPSATQLTSVVLLRDPQTGLFWWTYQPRQSGSVGDFGESFLRTSITCTSHDEIVNWRSAASPPRLWILKSSEHFPSMSDGRAHALASLENAHGELKTRWSESFREVDLARALPPDFLLLRNSAAPARATELRKVTNKDVHWAVLLDGPNGDSAILSLNDKYELISAKVVPRDHP